MTNLVFQCEVGVITKHFAVGTSVPWVKGKVGAVATQAETNPLLGSRILDLLEEGWTADDAMVAAIAQDNGREMRQCHVVDRLGNCAAWTGRDTVAHAGTLSQDGVSVAGNMLQNENVLSAMIDAYFQNLDVSIARRIYKALEAGELAGGDKRGPGQSAAILVACNQPFPVWNLRVDHNTTADILQQLQVLLDEAEKPYVRDFYDNLPSAFSDIDCTSGSAHHP